MKSIPEKAVLIRTKSDIDKDVDIMSTKLNKDFRDKNPVIITVLTGGVWLLANLLPRLRIDHYDLDVVMCSKYKDDQPLKKAKIVSTLSVPVKDRYVLLLDDILESGDTLKKLTNHIYQIGAKRVCSAVLVHRSKNDGVHPSYNGFLTKRTEYFFGCGMDYQGGLRYLEDIWGIELENLEGVAGAVPYHKPVR